MSDLKPVRRVLIVGGSGKIGKCICEAFLSEGADVIATYSKTSEPLNHPGQTMPLNLLETVSIESFVETTKTNKYVFDVIIFVSGLLPGFSPAEYGSNKIDEVFAVNLSGPCKLLFGLVDYLGKDARIIFFSSISAQRGSYDPIYAAAKGGLLSFVKSMVNHLPKTVTVNAVAPGLIEDSGMFAAMNEERADFHRKQTRSGLLLAIDDLARVVVDLTGIHWSHLNGACIDLNGGQYFR